MSHAIPCTSSCRSIHTGAVETSSKITLLTFQKGSHQGVLLYDQVEKIQAYMTDSQGIFQRTEFVPSENLEAINHKKIAAFKDALSTNCYLRITKLEEGDKESFKVYLFSKLVGGVLTSEQQSELQETLKLNHLGMTFCAQGRFEEALEQIQKSVAIQERLIPGSLEVADSYSNLGSVYMSQGKITEAIDQFEKSLTIRRKLDANSAETAAVYDNLGNLYHSQGKFDEALNLYQKGLEITKELIKNGRAKEGREVANSYNSIGAVHLAQGNRKKAMELFVESRRIHKKIDPDSTDTASVYMNIGALYKAANQLDSALKECEKSLTIYKQLAPNTLPTARAHNNMGELYRLLGDPEKGLEEFKRGLAILEKVAPGSLEMAISYRSIAHVYLSQEKLQDALPIFLKAYAIQENVLNSNHPDLLTLGNTVAKAALMLPDFGTALCYANKTIHNDPAYKWAYDTKGLALKGLGKLEEALKAFDKALICDPGYADASIHRLEVIAALAQEPDNMQSVADEALKAQNIQKTDYDLAKRLELEKIVRVSSQEATVELPQAQYQAGSKEYINRIEEMLAQIRAQVASHGVRIDAHAIMLSVVEEKLSTLEGRVLNVEDSLGILKLSSEQLKEKMERLPLSSPLLKKLLIEEEKLEAQKKQIEAINHNQDMRHYFYALLSELESAYIAAQVIESGKLQENKSEKYGKAAGYVSKVLELFPLIGQVASSFVTGAASLADTHTSIKEKRDFIRIRSLAPTLCDFDQIALSISLESTLQNEQVLVELDKAEVPSNWKTKIKALKDGLEGLMTAFLKDNETKAKMLGRLDAYKVIEHLQEETISENYALKEEKAEEGRHSLIGSLIVKAALTAHKPQKSPSIPEAPEQKTEQNRQEKTTEKTNSCCTVQ